MLWHSNKIKSSSIQHWRSHKPLGVRPALWETDPVCRRFLAGPQLAERRQQQAKPSLPGLPFAILAHPSIHSCAIWLGPGVAHLGCLSSLLVDGSVVGRALCLAVASCQTLIAHAGFPNHRPSLILLHSLCCLRIFIFLITPYLPSSRA